jgi:hypothetical protein
MSNLTPAGGMAKGFLYEKRGWHRLLYADTMQPVNLGPLCKDKYAARETFVTILDADMKPICQEVYRLEWVQPGVLCSDIDNYAWGWVPEMPREFRCPVDAPANSALEDMADLWVRQAHAWLDDVTKNWPRLVARPVTPEEAKTYRLARD